MAKVGDEAEAWLRSASENTVTGEPGSYLPVGQDWCPRCGDTNADEVTRLCLSCTYPDDPCSWHPYEQS
jgi:hypothetical protein